MLTAQWLQIKQQAFCLCSLAHAFKSSLFRHMIDRLSSTSASGIWNKKTLGINVAVVFIKSFIRSIGKISHVTGPHALVMTAQAYVSGPSASFPRATNAAAADVQLELIPDTTFTATVVFTHMCRHTTK